MRASFSSSSDAAQVGHVAAQDEDELQADGVEGEQVAQVGEETGGRLFGFGVSQHVEFVEQQRQAGLGTLAGQGLR